MKQFLKYVLATITGMVILGLFFSVVSVVTLLGVSSTSANFKVAENSVLILDLNGTLVERSDDDPFAGLFSSSENQTIGLDDVLQAIDKAKNEQNIKGIYMQGGALAGASPAMLEEIRNALEDFRKSGKFVVSYADSYTQGAYYLCSVADSVLINPQGMLDWKGLAMQTVYFKELLDKVGVKMQIFKVGTYKSAVEPYILNEMSEANREQITVFSGEIWKEMLDDVSKSRKLKAEVLNQLADTALCFSSADMYLKSGLVDKVTYSDDVPRVISNMMKLDDGREYKKVTLAEMANVVKNSPKNISGDIVAVYYAYGNIIDRPSGYSTSEIAASKVIKDLQKLTDDESVKAVVLRVNSGGGSAFASEQIWHEIVKMKEKKPVVVSMGGMAASGGYYISCAADRIFAEPTTLTGSIGIFGTFPDASELINNKLGLHFQTVKTNKYADFGDISRPMNTGEQGLLQAYVNRGYELFTKRCADGRKMKQDDIKAIAEGRVWTGVHAKKIGLVDELGGLADAVAYAKKKAKVEDCTVMRYPAKSNVFEVLMNRVSTDTYADAQMRETFGDYYDMFMTVRRLSGQSSVEASMPYIFKFNL